jgi:hypothetical protein
MPARLFANAPCETFDRLDLLRKSAYDLVERIGGRRPALGAKEAKQASRTTKADIHRSL